MAKTDKPTVKKTASKKTATKVNRVVKLPRVKVPGFLRKFGGYFKGAWQEIRQVRWPNRKATWSLTAAVLAFTAFWGLVVLGLDLLFQMMLNRVILN